MKTQTRYKNSNQGRGSIPATDSQIRMLYAICKKINWTWEELALYAQIHAGYPYHEIGEQLPKILTKKEAWHVCNGLGELQDEPERAMEMFRKLRAEQPDVEANWKRYWEDQNSESDSYWKPSSTSPNLQPNATFPVKRTCPECKRMYAQAEAQYCMVDGHKLDSRPSCQNCGEPLPKPSAKFCMECGAEQAA